ncbi:hypothetical protein D3C85_1487680 [compost metagenome]
MGNARLQSLTGILQSCGGRGCGPLLQGLGGLSQTGYLRFEALQAGIEPLLVSQVAHRLVAQDYENAEADQPKPEQALHHHGGGQAPG